MHLVMGSWRPASAYKLMDRSAMSRHNLQTLLTLQKLRWLGCVGDNTSDNMELKLSLSQIKPFCDASESSQECIRGHHVELIQTTRHFCPVDCAVVTLILTFYVRIIKESYLMWSEICLYPRCCDNVCLMNVARVAGPKFKFWAWSTTVSTTRTKSQIIHKTLMYIVRPHEKVFIKRPQLFLFIIDGEILCDCSTVLGPIDFWAEVLILRISDRYMAHFCRIQFLYNYFWN